MATLRDDSKGQWTSEHSLSAISAGSLQRIADAAEAMARNHNDLLREVEQLKGLVEYWSDEATGRARTIAGLRGYIARLKAGR